MDIICAWCEKIIDGEESCTVEVPGGLIGLKNARAIVAISASGPVRPYHRPCWTTKMRLPPV